MLREAHKLEQRLCGLQVKIFHISFTTHIGLLKKGGSGKP